MLLNNPSDVKPLVVAQNVQFKYSINGPWILDDVTASLYPARVTCLLGPNGSGKTTLARLLIGELLPNHGRLQRISNLRYVIQYQDFSKNLLPWYTARKNISLLRKTRTDARFIAEWYHASGFDRWSDQTVWNLSGGQRQILSVMLLLLLESHVAIFDEPFSAIDPRRAFLFWQLFRQWVKRTQASTLIITHNLEEAIALGDEVLLLRPDTTPHLEHFVIDRKKIDRPHLDMLQIQKLRTELLTSIY